MTTRRPSTRIRHDPATAAAVMDNPDALHIVRPSNLVGLEIAYRVQVPPESLERAQLKLGALCEISSEDGSTGYGIAWRADDRMGPRPKNRPIKMTEYIRSAFAFQEGSRVTIQSTKTKIHHADKIVVSDITPAEFGKSEDLEDGCWKARLTGLFANCEALTPGISFDIADKRKMRKRYYIEHIESASVPNDAPGLFKFTDGTHLVFPAQGSDAVGPSNPHVDNGGPVAVDPLYYRLNTDRIGGLTEQCSTLDYYVRQILDIDLYSSYGVPVINNPILLHGFEGTGKTMLLNQLAQVPFRKVIRLDRRSLNSGSVAKNRSIIQTSFQDATANQPSLILMDNLERLVPTDDDTYADDIAAELEKIGLHSRVMVVGATRALTNIHAQLLSDHGFTEWLELPTPDLAAREHILNILRGKLTEGVDSISSILASRTSGFTGRDLALLHTKASRAAFAHVDRERGVLSMQSPPRGQQFSMQSSPQPDPSPPQSPSAPRRPSPLKELPLLSPLTSPRSASALPRYSQLSDIVGSTDIGPAEAGSADARPSNKVSVDVKTAQIESTDIDTSSRAVPRFTSTRVKTTLTDYELVLPSVRPAALREIQANRPGIQWRDIGGSSDVEQIFEKIIAWPQKYPDTCKAWGWKPPKGVLLYGPPGCSKTLTAQAVANNHALNFISIKGAELISMYVGESERAIRDIFRKARAATPCMIFFDEIDAIAGVREGSSKGLNVLTTLLTEMDGFDTLHDVHVLAATNRPETLDPAIMRPGRFDSHVYIEPPNEIARKEILNMMCTDVRIADDVNLDILVQETERYSGAELVQICRACKGRAMEREITGGQIAFVTAADFEQVLKTTARGITEEMLEGYRMFASSRTTG